MNTTNVAVPEVGRSEDILKYTRSMLTSLRRQKMITTYILDYSKVAMHSKDFEQVGKAQQTFADNKVFKSGKQSTLNR